MIEGKMTVDTTLRTADEIVRTLEALGVRYAFGLSGGAIAPIWHALWKSTERGIIKTMHFRNEAGAGFAATELSIATGRPVVVFSTTGPGITNSITGLMAARWEGAKVIFISPASPLSQQGRWAFQETSPMTLPLQGILGSGPLFHYSTTINCVEDVPVALKRVALGVARPGGFVAHLNIPASVQNSNLLKPLTIEQERLPLVAPESIIQKCADLLNRAPFAIWVGFGARDAANEIRALAEKSGAVVFCSPRGKGIFPENHPQFIGVSGFGGNDSVVEWFQKNRPQNVLVLGSRLGEFTSFWSPDFLPSKELIHVDIDPTVPGVSYPDKATVSVLSEIRPFLSALQSKLESFKPILPKERPRQSAEVMSRPEDPNYVRHAVLMEAIQRVAVEAHDAAVITEAGNAFAWGSSSFYFSSPKYRVSSGFGAMGHAVTGVLGISLAGGKAVAIVGDGAMLMNNEINTAIKYNIPAVWIVLNDGGYRMVDHGMRSYGFYGVDCDIPPTDFVGLARAMGADGVTIRNEKELDFALSKAMESSRPFIVDVIIDPDCPPPFGRRMQTLTE